MIIQDIVMFVVQNSVNAVRAAAAARQVAAVRDRCWAQQSYLGEWSVDSWDSGSSAWH